MKQQFRIALFVIALTLIFAFLDAAGSHGKDYTLAFGLICCSSGIIWVPIGIALAVRDKTRKIGHGFLIGAGIIFLVGTGACSTLLM